MRASVAMNFGAAGIEPYDERIKKLSGRMGVNLTRGYEIAGEAFSAKSNLSDEQAMAALEAVAEAQGRSGDVGSIKAFSSATMDYMNRNPTADPARSSA